jgi:mannose-6-phosphate isomerase-like protein (cupin superfamily)
MVHAASSAARTFQEGIMNNRLIAISIAAIPRILVVFLLLALGGEIVAAEQRASEVTPSGISRRPVLEVSLGTPPSVGWKWLVQERTGPQATGILRHTNPGLYYTLEGTHELVRGNRAETFPAGQAILVPVGMEHIHRMLPVAAGGRKLEIYFAPGDQLRPVPRGVQILHFSDEPLKVKSGVSYTLRVDEYTFTPRARWERTPRTPSINYVLEGIVSRRMGDQLFRNERASVLELPTGERFTAFNDGTTPMRYLAVELVRTSAAIPTPSH